MAQRYYWLKLKEDFFDEKLVKLLRRLPDGDAVTIVYLKLLLKTLNTDGKILLDGLLPDQEEEIALWIDEDVNVVKLTIVALKKYNAIEIIDSETLYINTIELMVGSECFSAERVRRYRENKQKLLPSNARVTLGNEEKEKREDKERDKEKIIPFNYQELFDYYVSLDLINHKKLSTEIKDAMKSVKDKYTFDELKLMIQRHSLVVDKSKGDTYPVTKRTLITFFTQKAGKTAGSPLICSEYLDDGIKWINYQNDIYGKGKKQPKKAFELERTYTDEELDDIIFGDEL
jgi:predicted phage replisome organizer